MLGQVRAGCPEDKPKRSGTVAAGPWQVLSTEHGPPETRATPGVRQESRLWYRQAASGWLEVLPIGNGRLGAMVWGGAEQERFDLNIDTLWSGGPRAPLVEGSASVLPSYAGQ